MLATEKPENTPQDMSSSSRGALLPGQAKDNLQSTTEAKYISACQATKEAVWLRQLCTDIGETNAEPTAILIDHQIDS